MKQLNCKWGNSMDFVKQYVHTHEQVYNFFGETSKRTMLLAANYTLAGKSFSGMTLQKKREELVLLNKDVSYSFRENLISENLAVQFLIGDENNTDLECFFNRVKILVDVGFPKKSNTLSAALYLTDEVGHAERGYKLHKEMKKFHPFLTGADDIPISIFITRYPHIKVEGLAKLMNDYYNELKGTFKMGEALQQLSQLLTLWSPTYNEHLVPYVKQLKLELEKQKVTVSHKHYPLIGILALNVSNHHVIEEVISFYNKLKNTKLLKHNKDIALIIAIKKIILQNKKELELVELAGTPQITDLLNFLSYAVEIPVGFGEIILENIILD